MDYKIEVRIGETEITDLGREQAIAHATIRAWHRAVGDSSPKRSLVLRTTEERPAEYGIYVRFLFVVDVLS